jgi:hypothetical protein
MTLDFNSSKASVTQDSVRVPPFLRGAGHSSDQEWGKLESARMLCCFIAAGGSNDCPHSLFFPQLDLLLPEFLYFCRRLTAGSMKFLWKKAPRRCRIDTTFIMKTKFSWRRF